MGATFVALNEPKPLLPLADLLRENAEAELLRLKHDLALEHRRDGCPLDRGFGACVFHSGSPLPGWPEVPR